jgi:hypothetical protein
VLPRCQLSLVYRRFFVCGTTICAFGRASSASPSFVELIKLVVCGSRSGSPIKTFFGLPRFFVCSSACRLKCVSSVSPPFFGSNLFFVCELRSASSVSTFFGLPRFFGGGPTICRFRSASSVSPSSSVYLVSLILVLVAD